METIFSAKLKSLRTEYNMSQTDLAKLLGVSRSCISSYENKQRSPDQETLIKIASLFNVSTDYLLGVSVSDIEKYAVYSDVLTEINDVLYRSNISSEKKQAIVTELRDYFNWKMEQAQRKYP